MRFPATLLLLCGGLMPAMAGDGFDVTVLGARGGIEDGNLSAFMIAPHGDRRAVTCDAGSLVNGLRVAEARGTLKSADIPADSPYTPVGHALAEDLKGYLISHAHMDHLAGIVIASPDDSKKPIYGLASVNERISRNYFNWEAWPNFATIGKEPRLGKYELVDLAPAAKTELTGTAMQVTAFPLSHGGTESTAFMLESGEDVVLCLGDTGPDEVEKGTALKTLWEAAAPALRDGRLKGLIIEVSYANAQPDNLLFGHLTPNWLLKSMRDLEALAGKGSLKDIPVVISHVKYSLKKGDTPQQIIARELEAGNELGVRFVIPEQGDAIRM